MLNPVSTAEAVPVLIAADFVSDGERQKTRRLQ